MNLIEIKGVNKSFDNFQLKDININIEEGYIYGFIGQNGAGKTTTLSLIMGMQKQDSGTITVLDKNTLKDIDLIKDEIGYIADDLYFPETFNTKDVASIMKDFYKSFDIEVYNEYIKRFNLPTNKSVKEFSRGMKIKLMFASILSRKTRLLLLDEPTSGLDPVIRNEILDILQQYIEDGKHSVFFSTHITSDLEKIADHITMIDNGQIILSDYKDNLINDYSIIKGSSDLFNDELKNKCVKSTSSKYNSEGLIRNKYLPLNRNIIIEKPNLEEIFVNFVNSKREAI